MKHTFILKNTFQSILLAGMFFGIVGVVHAQIPGPGQVGGMGQGGAPAGQFPSSGPGALPGQPDPSKLQRGSTDEQGMPDKKDSSRDSSQGQGVGLPKRDSGVGSGVLNPSGGAKDPSAPGAPSRPGGY